ncbi:MAG: hypothetical protein GX774_05635 [Armatimonadetes bacterium]|jgi:hypothetical protein|nr:hypothetical protein [Armatimonadota bacterium]
MNPDVPNPRPVALARIAALLALALLLAGFGAGCRRSGQPAERTVTPATESRRAQPSPISRQVERANVVYVTDSGKKFHRLGCKYLKKSRHERSRKEAQESGYTACSVCEP